MIPSSISEIFLDGKKFYVKRDDLIDSFLAGNKYRKLYSLLQTPSKKYNKIISYGGTQSNAMLALAALCKQKSWQFIYYTKPIANSMKNQKFGNYYDALNFGMQHYEIEHSIYQNYIASLRTIVDEKAYVVDQGGADILAKDGIEILADEIRSANLKIRSLATPSATGTTALFLALALPEYRVYTTPSVGDQFYLREQMQALGVIPDNLIILKPSKKYHFAKLYPEFLDTYRKLLDAGIEFDLLYAPLLWKTLLEQVDDVFLYIHSGGVSGNKSMLERYKRLKKE